MNAKIRPTSLLFKTNPYQDWEDFDFLLLEAFQLMQDEQCRQCGHPVWLCGSNKFVSWKVETTVCKATKAIKEWEDKQLPADKREKDPLVRAEWGKYTSAIPKPFDDGVNKIPLPTRSDYFKQ